MQAIFVIKSPKFIKSYEQQSDWESSALAALEFAAINVAAEFFTIREFSRFNLPQTFLPVVRHEADKLHQLGCDLESMALRLGVFWLALVSVRTVSVLHLVLNVQLATNGV